MRSARPRGWRGEAQASRRLGSRGAGAPCGPKGGRRRGCFRPRRSLRPGAGRARRTRTAGCGPGRREWKGPGPGRWLGSRGRPHRAPPCEGRTHGLARARRRGDAAGRIVQKETEGRALAQGHQPGVAGGSGTRTPAVRLLTAVEVGRGQGVARVGRSEAPSLPACLQLPRNWGRPRLVWKQYPGQSRGEDILEGSVQQKEE